jgi:O-antigen/teichoic acid export membrane protein
MAQSRTKNSIKNSATGLLSQGLTILLKFLVRLVFLRLFVKEYLGINGLFYNILTVLSLTELGVGDAIVYSMYKPLAVKDEPKLARLMKFYSKAYAIIGVAVTVIGLALIPLLPFIVESMPKDAFLNKNFSFIYILFLLNSSLSYFFSYKRSIVAADQKNYIINSISIGTNILQSIFQIGVLLIFPKPYSFIAYLVVQVIITIATNIIISNKADKMYPFIKDRKNIPALEKEEKSKLLSNIKAITIYKVGSVALDGTDNIIISKFCGLELVGSLSNYTLVTTSLQMFLAQIANSVTHSVGNVVAVENKEKNRFVFDSLVLLNFLIYGFSSACLFALFQDFIRLFATDDYLLSVPTMAIIVINFFLYGSMNVIWTYRSTMGIFIYGKYRPLVSAIINIVISIILAKYLDITGVLLGTTITRLVTNIWFDPYIVFKHGFKESVFPYYLTYIKNFLIVAVISAIAFFINSLLPFGLWWFILKVLITVFLVSGLLLAVSFRKTEFKFIFNRVKSVILKK